MVEGIFQGLTDVVDAISDTGASIFHSIARGLQHVANNTMVVTTEVADDITGFFTAAGGPAVFGLYLVNFCIVVYLAYQHWVGFGMARPPPLVPPRIIH